MDKLTKQEQLVVNLMRQGYQIDLTTKRSSQYNHKAKDNLDNYPVLLSYHSTESGSLGWWEGHKENNNLPTIKITIFDT